MLKNFSKNKHKTLSLQAILCFFYFNKPIGYF